MSLTPSVSLFGLSPELPRSRAVCETGSNSVVPIRDFPKVEMVIAYASLDREGWR